MPKETEKPKQGRPPLAKPKVQLSTTVLPETLEKLRAEAEKRSLSTPGQVLDEDFGGAD